MVAPLISWIISIIIIIIGGSLLNWNRILINFTGKRVAILGQRVTGKTHLATFLSKGSVPEKYEATMGSTKTQSRRFQLKDLDLKIKESCDVSGDNSAQNHHEWKTLYNHADVVFYLLRADKLIAGDKKVEDRVRGDFRHIGDWRNERQIKPIFYIVGTFCDLDPVFSKVSENTQGEYLDRFRRLPVIMDLVALGGGGSQVKVVVGSMKTLQLTEQLVYRIFKELQS